MSPQSRHAGISDKVLEAERDKGNIDLLAHSDDAGYVIFETTDKTFRIKNGLFEELNEPKLKYATL